MIVTDYWTVSSLVSNSLYPTTLIVPKILVIHVDMFLWFYWICGVAIIRFEYRKVIKKSSHFLPPVELRKTFRVMPFGPKNALEFYTIMIQSLRKEWLLLFADTKHAISFDTVPVTLVCNDKMIIDDILLYFTYVPSYLHHFARVSQVFTKYRLSCELTQCDFFKPRVEFVGYENCPAKSKFDLIQHWSLPPNAISLLSFVGLYGLYSRHFP